MRKPALLAAAVAALLSFAFVPSAAHTPTAVAVESSAPGCGAGGTPRDSIAGHLYKYCGQYWPLTKLPIRIHINDANAKPNAAAFRQAVQLAVLEWDAAAPPVSGTGPRPGGCASARVICVSSTSSGPGSTGEVEVRWGDTGSLGLPAYANIFPATGPISSGYVVLNWNLTWFGLRLSEDLDDAAVGVPAGVAAGMCGPAPALCPATYDLMGILMHELGHVIGLEDLNAGQTCTDDPGRCGWPGDLSDAPDYMQVMYAFYYRGSTTKRVLGAGDLAGLYRVIEDVLA